MYTKEDFKLIEEENDRWDVYDSTDGMYRIFVSSLFCVVYENHFGNWVGLYEEDPLKTLEEAIKFINELDIDV